MGGISKCEGLRSCRRMNCCSLQNLRSFGPYSDTSPDFSHVEENWITKYNIQIEATALILAMKNNIEPL